MTVLDNMLRRGYFPKELPPCFNTRTLADALNDPRFVADNVFKAPKPSNRTQLVNASQSVSLPTSHSLINPGKNRRQLQIPHPTHFYSLSKALNDNWNDIISHCQCSTLSLSTPKLDPENNRAIVLNESGDVRPLRRIADRTHGNFLLVCDIAAFYNSIYTHSIPWAFHTKGVAKQLRKDSLYGNLIDKLTRNGQDGQTRGIPTGTDTSFVIGESILSAVDREIVSRPSHIKGFRFYDDFEIVCQDEISAREVLITIEECLREFELQLNDRKTRIVSLPELLDHEWVSALRNFSLNPIPTGMCLVDFTDLAFRLSKNFPHDQVLKYALKILFKVDATEIWLIYQDILLQILRSEPQLARLVSHQLITYSLKGLSLGKEKLKETLENNITRYMKLGATNEVVWCIWMCLLFGLHIDEKVASVLTQTDDSFIGILVLDAREKGLIDESLDMTRWSQLMKEDEIYNKSWLFVYEAAAQGWLPILDASDYINMHDCFGALNSFGVRFYNPANYNITQSLLQELYLYERMY